MAHTVRFLHLADLHIGLRVSRFEESIVKKIQEARFLALDNALRIAQERRVDFILIAGDIFDDNAVPLVDALRVFDDLKGKPVATFILPGNHDPYRAGSVWQRSPWNAWEGTRIRLLSERKPVPFSENVVIYPCPVIQKTSLDDPTGWIEKPAAPSSAIRIGVAHGTVMDRATLPPDDHPIPVGAAGKRGLDYLALGHWHGAKVFDGGRMAYPGTHEQMGYGKSVDFSLGWEAYAPSPDREEFLGGAFGRALLVTVNKEGGASEVLTEAADTGHYLWGSEIHDGVDDEMLARLFSEIATRSNTERRLLHLTLKGVISAEAMIRLESFEKMLDRYAHADLDKEGLEIRPSDEEIAGVLGQGILKHVFARLKSQKENCPPGETRKVLEAAVNILYRLARERGGK
jgi:predicted phosphodiesterase